MGLQGNLRDAASLRRPYPLADEVTMKSSTRWDAVRQRDRTADGSFVYAVKTTGVFCRPSCASRVPLRRNVEFFERQEQAAKAGYRPCKRCRPTKADPRRERNRILVTACRLLEAKEGVARNDEVAAAVGLSPYYFQRFFKSRLGVSPQQYRRRVLAERAKAELIDAESVTQAVFAAGYSSSSRFYEGPGRELGMPARETRTGATGHAIRYAVRACSLGQLLVAWTDRGACDIRLGDSAEQVTRALSKRFPGAVLARTGLPVWIEAVAELVERPHSADIPLDIRGTAFQQRVWQELRRIPMGETRSYSDVARALGTPGASRAVARACATNPLAVVVPCHRVVRSDGDLSGYRWGRDRKEELLRREASGSRPPATWLKQ
jgi:AraC family transcriptional regulator of adaptative response/methylated-DNA-[protein]-cysteine methyltransferase